VHELERLTALLRFLMWFQLLFVARVGEENKYENGVAIFVA